MSKTLNVRPYRSETEPEICRSRSLRLGMRRLRAEGPKMRRSDRAGTAFMRSEEAGIGSERAEEGILSLFSLLKRVIGGGGTNRVRSGA